MSEPLTFTLPPELLEQIAQRAAAILAEQRRTSTDEASEVLSPQDAARLLGLHPRTILRAIGSGDLQAVKVRNRWRIRRRARPLARPECVRATYGRRRPPPRRRLLVTTAALRRVRRGCRLMDVQP